MERSEAKAIQKQRNKARKQAEKYQKLCWTTPIGSKEFTEYQARYQAALVDLENTSLTYKQALRQFI